MDTKLARRPETIGEIIVDQLETAPGRQVDDMGMGTGTGAEFEELRGGGEFCGRRAACRMGLDTVVASSLGGGDIGADDLLIFVMYAKRQDAVGKRIEDREYLV